MANKSTIFLILIIVLFTVFVGIIYSLLEMDKDSNIRGPLAAEIYAVSRNIFYPAANRLQQYCNLNPPARTTHSADIQDAWELQYLAINIRHGDRSAINHIKGTTKNYGTVKGNNSFFINSEALEHVYRLKGFELNPLPRGSEKLKHKGVSS